MENNKFNISGIIWLYNKRIELILEDTQKNIEEKLKQLFDIKNELAEEDYSTKIFLLTYTEIPKEEIEKTDIVTKFFKKVGEEIGNLDSMQKIRNYQDNLIELLSKVEQDIQTLQGKEFDVPKTQETILSQNEVLLLIKCLMKQHFITRTKTKAGKGFNELTNFSKNTIANGLINPFFSDDEIDKMIKNFYEAIGYLETLKSN